MVLRRITIVLDQRVLGYRGKAHSAYGLMTGVGSQLCFDPTLTEAKDKVVLDVIAEQKNVPALLLMKPGAEPSSMTIPRDRKLFTEELVTEWLQAQLKD